MSTFEEQYAERVSDSLTAFSVFVAQAERAKESGKDAAVALAHVQYTHGLYVLADARDGVTDEAGSPMTASLALLVESLGQASGVDRTHGDEMAAKVRGMLGAGIDLAAEVTERAESLMARWAASAPAKSSRKGSGSKGSSGQGINVEMKCSCGWANHDVTSTNSARWSWTKHLAGQSHGIKGGGREGRIGKDHPDYAVITQAIDPVSKGVETTTQHLGLALSDGTKVYALVGA